MKRENKTINYSIRNKLFIYLTVIGIIPAFLIAYFVYRYGYEKAFYDRTLYYDSVIKRIVTETKYINDLDIDDENTIYINNGKKYYRIEYLYDLIGADQEEINLSYTREDAPTEEKDIKIFKNSYKYHVPIDDEIDLSVEVNKLDYLKYDYQLGEIFFRGFAIHIVLIITSSFIISYYLSRDLYNITKNIRGMVRKNRKEEPHTNVHIKELQDIEKEVELMLDTKEKLLKENYSLELENKKSHIKMLQAQISPHFLYNALDSINWRLIENGDYETSRILISLSKTLRYSIEDSKELVPIKEEFDEIDNYLVVQKNRYYDSFNYEIHVDEKVKDFLIPKMIIQPLVENSLKHGLDGVDNAMILVQAMLVENQVIINVYDNGKGLSKDRLKVINEALEEDKDIYYDGRTHIGLKNTYLRLKGYYPSCKFKVESVLDAYTSITLSLEVSNEVINCRG